jgi:thiamine pyrophosphate-dependent acetolactate synthase large subunit-like protein
MAYSVLYAPTLSAKMPDVSRLISVESDSMGAAINAACKLIHDGATVWQINGPGGFMMERGDIETECVRRENGN